MLKFFWLLALLVTIYVWVLYLKRVHPQKKLKEDNGGVKVIQTETRVGRDLRVTVLQIGDEQFSVFNSSSGIEVKKTNIDEKILKRKWEKSLEKESKGILSKVSNKWRGS